MESEPIFWIIVDGVVNDKRDWEREKWPDKPIAINGVFGLHEKEEEHDVEDEKCSHMDIKELIKVPFEAHNAIMDEEQKDGETQRIYKPSDQIVGKHPTEEDIAIHNHQKWEVEGKKFLLSDKAIKVNAKSNGKETSWVNEPREVIHHKAHK